MKVLAFDHYGTPDVLAFRDIDMPRPGDGEVLVRVHAVSINDWDWALLTGDWINRLITAGLFRPRVRVLGSDVAGTVVALGAGVTKLRVGDAVFGDLSGRWGGFAEHVVARESALAPKPRGMTFVQAAALPQAGGLAVQGLIDHGNMRPGLRLLVNGGGGGVGTFGAQLAKLHGAVVSGVDRSEKHAAMRAVGFDHVIDFTREDYTRGDAKYDLVLDVKSMRSPFACARALAPGGTYVTVGGSIARLLQLLVAWPFIRLATRKQLRVVALKLNRDLAYLGEQFEAGKLVPVVDGPWAFADAIAALRHYGSGRQIGKVVIEVVSEPDVTSD